MAGSVLPAVIEAASRIALPAVGLLLLYTVGVAVYRLVFHPLARFPGPRLAALSNWYEFYYDVVQQGQFTSHIQELHKKYGMFFDFLLPLLPRYRYLIYRYFF